MPCWSRRYCLFKLMMIPIFPRDNTVFSLMSIRVSTMGIRHCFTQFCRISYRRIVTHCDPNLFSLAPPLRVPFFCTPTPASTPTKKHEWDSTGMSHQQWTVVPGVDIVPGVDMGILTGTKGVLHRPFMKMNYELHVCSCSVSVMP